MAPANERHHVVAAAWLFTDSPASGANAAMYASAATFGSVPASVMNAPP